MVGDFVGVAEDAVVGEVVSDLVGVAEVAELGAVVREVVGDLFGETEVAEVGAVVFEVFVCLAATPSGAVKKRTKKKWNFILFFISRFCEEGKL